MPMKISQLYTYPVKSLLPTRISSATLTKHGFQYDRRYMLLKVQDDGTLKNMHLVHFPETTLFHTDITYPDGADEPGRITVTFHPPVGDSAARQPESLDLPLEPDAAELSGLDIEMHSSPTKAYDMGPSFNAWFSRCFGYDVKLAYLGHNSRNVLMSRSPNAQPAQSGGWLSSIASSIPLLGSATDKDEITFQDCAAFLVVSAKSLENVSGRLPEGVEMDVVKFRPNIVVEGADEPWDEDFWAELAIGDATILLYHNCVRCASINIDFSRGKPGTGPTGEVLKRMQKDRRVDAGAKYSPVFGRYGFPGGKDAGKRISVGDEVNIVRRNSERTKFDWPKLG